MKSVDGILLGLTALAVGAGVGLVYRAHHQGDVRVPSVFTESAAAAERPPIPSPAPRGGARMARLPDSAGPSNRVECRGGLLVEVTPQGPMAVFRNGQLAQCEIHAATPEEARRVSSADPSDL